MSINNSQIEAYINLLLKWQKSVNLVSPNTLGEIRERHINDSTQLAKLIPEGVKTIIDIGSGAGLPGIPLAIETGITTYLIESDRKKALFMEEVIRNLKLDAKVINQRIENVESLKLNEPVVITARALADLEKLLDLINSLLVKNNIAVYSLLLLKGKNVEAEIKNAETHWDIEFERHQSETEPTSSILNIKSLVKR